MVVGVAWVVLVAVSGACSPSDLGPRPAVLSVSIDQSDLTLAVGEESDPLSASVVAVGGADEGVVWSSGAPGVASVDPVSGVVTGVSVGPAAVVASSAFDPARSDAIVVTVVEAPTVLGVSIDQGYVGLVVGESIDLTASVEAVGGADESVVWSSDAPGVVSVDVASGAVTALAAGSAGVVATSTFDGVSSDGVTVTVTAAPEVVSVVIDQGDFELELGEEATVTASVVTSGGASSGVSWSSDDPLVANVGADSGLVAGVGVGSARITATSDVDPSVSDWVGVEVVLPPNEAPVAAFERVPAGGFVPLTVEFDAGASSDSDGHALTFSWDFGDGATGSGERMSHMYSRSGEHRVVLTVSDPYGAASVAEAMVTVGPFGSEVRLAEATPPRDYYNRHWIAVDEGTALVPVIASEYATEFTRVDVYDRGDGGWMRSGALPPASGPGARDVGRAVELSGSTAAVMSIEQVTPEESVIRVYERDDAGAWQERAVLLRGDGVGTDSLSYRADVSMALRDDVLVVGVPDGDFEGFDSHARAYVRDHGGEGVWGLAQEFPLPASSPTFGSGWYGTDVAVGANGDVIAVAQSLQNNDGGFYGQAVYIYERVEPGVDNWELVQKVTDLPGAYSAYVEIDGSTLAVTEMPYVVGGLIWVRVYERSSGGTGPYEAVVTHTLDALVDDGYTAEGTVASIRLMEATLAVGLAPLGCSDGGVEPPPPGGCGPGEVYLFGRDVGGAGAWGQAQVVRPMDGFQHQGFGQAVDLSSDGRALLVAAGPLYSLSLPAEIFVYER